MIVEALAAVALTMIGAGLLVAWSGGISRSVLVWLALPTGAAAYLLVSLVLFAVVDRVSPWPAVVLASVPGLLGFWHAARSGRLGGQIPALLTAVAWVFFGAMLAWLVPVTRLTIDSGEYLLGAAQIQADGARDLMAPYLLKRQMGMQALHAFSTSPIRAHVAWVSPLFGVAAVGFATSLLWTRLTASRRTRLGLLVGIVAFLGSSSRFLYDFFYVHPHIQVAMYLLLAVAGIWLAVTESKAAWAMLAGLALAVLLLFRAEAPVLVAVVLVAAAATPADRLARRLVALPSLVTVVLWYGAVLWSSAPEGSEIGVTEPVFSSLVAVIAAASLVLLLGLPALERWRPLVGRALVPGVIGVLVVYVATDPILLRDSIVATFRNQKRLGWWVMTWAVAVPLAVLALAVARFRLSELWSRLVVAFGVLFFVFPYLRGSPWRVGPGDSGNRMLADFLLVVLVFVVLAAFDDPDEVRADAR